MCFEANEVSKAMIFEANATEFQRHPTEASYLYESHIFLRISIDLLSLVIFSVWSPSPLCQAYSMYWEGS
jgi:hypothetical protein